MGKGTKLRIIDNWVLNPLGRTSVCMEKIFYKTLLTPHVIFQSLFSPCASVVLRGNMLNAVSDNKTDSAEEPHGYAVLMSCSQQIFSELWRVLKCSIWRWQNAADWMKVMSGICWLSAHEHRNSLNCNAKKFNSGNWFWEMKNYFTLVYKSYVNMWNH